MIKVNFNYEIRYLNVEKKQVLWRKEYNRVNDKYFCFDVRQKDIFFKS